MSIPSYLLTVTSDRYDLHWEEQTLASLPDMSVKLAAQRCEDEDSIIEAARDADALLVTSRDAVSRRVIANLGKCRVISRYAVGIDNIDLDVATDFGIVVTHVPDYCTEEVADHALALLLALNRRIVELDRDLRDGAWVRNSYHTSRILRGSVPPLREQTLGLIGIGRIGTSVARRGAAFGMRILAADPYLSPEIIVSRGAVPVDMETLLAESDIISIHCPLTVETERMIDERWLSRVKPGAVLVNTARGPIVDTAVLIGALQTGKLAGAALDVTVPEPLPLDSLLYAMPNVILTPHAAYYSERSIHRVREDALAGVLSVLRGQFPRVVANPAILTRLELSPYTPT